MPYRNIPWFHSLSLKGTIALIVMALGLLVGALWVVNTTGKEKVLEESSKLIEETGNNVIGSLMGRSKEIASLVRGIAAVTESFQKMRLLTTKFSPAYLILMETSKWPVAGFGLKPINLKRAWKEIVFSGAGKEMAHSNITMTITIPPAKDIIMKNGMW